MIRSIFTPSRLMVSYQATRSMATISASLVKELRERTGSPMMECKKALQAEGVDGDVEKAIEHLKKQGMAAVKKSAGREANEGLVSLALDANQTTGALVELASETDFVARNESFSSLVGDLSQVALAMDNVATLEDFAKLNNGAGTVADSVVELTSKMRENVQAKRVIQVQIDEQNGVVGGYLHNKITPYAGTLATLVALKVDAPLADRQPLVDLSKQLSMHVAAASPLFINRKAVDSAYIENERAILVEQVTQSELAKGKEVEPEVLEKRVKKKVDKALNKQLEEVILMDQPFMLGAQGKTKVKDVIKKVERETKSKIEVASFNRFKVGEENKKGEQLMVKC